jgi:hypothetical protein
MKRTLFYLCLVPTLLLFAACAKAPEQTAKTEEASNPFVGTWNLNVDKSTFNPPSSALKSHVVLIEAQENGLKFTLDQVDAEGKATHVEEAPKFDGNAYPIIGSETEDSVTIKRVDNNSFELVSMKDAKEVSRVQVVISEEGKLSTATIKSKDENGQEITSTLIYDKQ